MRTEKEIDTPKKNVQCTYEEEKKEERRDKREEEKQPDSMFYILLLFLSCSTCEKIEKEAWVLSPWCKQEVQMEVQTLPCPCSATPHS